MENTPITAPEFKRRLVALLGSGGGPWLPRRPRDRHILFRCATRDLAPDRSLSEREVNGLLEAWLQSVGRPLEIDRVALRRELVDAGYLERDTAGREYRVRREGGGAVAFLTEVEAVDPEETLTAARIRTEERRRRALAGGAPGKS